MCQSGFNNLLWFSKFLVDNYAKIESERLLYLLQNQSKLRAHSCIHLRDLTNADGNPKGIVQRVILPASFTDGPCHIQEATEDATCVEKLGRSELSVTFTCNYEWPEIQDSLFPNQLANERHDDIAHVFHAIP